MDIYQLTDDFAYKTFTIIGEKVEYITLNGQPLIGSWKEKQGEVYKNYDNKGEKDGFDARICGGLFVMEKEKAILFVQRTNVKAELLPFKIINVKKDFVFINILNIVKSINFEGISPMKLGELTRNNDLYFYEEAGENILFRDALYTNMLYCTKEVENILNELDIKGLALKKVGKVAPIPSFPKERNIFNR